jgi:rhodanese-related sulfurtransferase
MKIGGLMAALVAALSMSGGALAESLTPSEQAAVHRAVDQFLSSLPQNANYDVTAEDVLERIKADMGDFVILDVRMPREKKYDVAHLPGAMHAAVHELAKPETLAKLPKDKDIIVHCDTGQQQNKAVAALRMLGYKAYGMRWGYMSWQPAPPSEVTMNVINRTYTKAYPIEK